MIKLYQIAKSLSKIKMATTTVAIDFSIRRIYCKRTLVLPQLFIGDNFEFCLGICYVCGLEKEKH